MILYECTDVCFHYENVQVVDNLSFSIKEGDYFCIVGENGSGKTTLMKGLLGLQPAFSGKIQISDSVKHTRIGYMSQQTAIQKDFPASVWEIIISGMLSHRGILPGYGLKDKEEAKRNMRLLGIENLAKKSFRNLSGGERQRVLLARALCATEKVLFLDEPVSGLDPVISKEFYELLRILNKENSITIILISHGVQEVIDHADAILHLSHGSYFYGNVSEYKNSSYGKQFIGGTIK